MGRYPYLGLALVLILGACGATESGGTTPTPTNPPATTITTTTTTSTPPVTTAGPTTGGWTRSVIENPVSPACCDAPVFAPASPKSQIPGDGWPADGFYDLAATRLTEPPGTLQVEIRRWVPCAELPEQCSPDPPGNGVTADRTTTVTRFLDLNDELTVVLWPLWENYDNGPTALVGTGADFAELLLDGIDHAFIEWVLNPRQAGVPVEQIGQDLTARSADPTFPFGSPPGFGFAYRGPLGSYLTANPEWLLETAEPWPPGHNGLYNWWATLEIQNGQPTLTVYANQIAG